MSAVPQDFMHAPVRLRAARRIETRPPAPPAASPADAGERAEQTFWQWFAVGVLFFCWVAEATLCAERGF